MYSSNLFSRRYATFWGYFQCKTSHLNNCRSLPLPRNIFLKGRKLESYSLQQFELGSSCRRDCTMSQTELSSSYLHMKGEKTILPLKINELNNSRFAKHLVKC